MARLNDNFTLSAPVPIDDKLGWWDDATGEWKPFASRQDAIDKTPYYRFRTMTLPVEEGGDVVEYWFKMGVEDDDLVLKTSQADLSNYYTKTELQTSGQSSVHWDNITNVPDLSVLWENITGDQSSVEVGGFANTVGYITLADLPPFESTLQEVLTTGDIATRGAYFNIPEELALGADTEIKIGDYDLVNDPGGFSVGIRVHNPIVGFNTDIGALGVRVTASTTQYAYMEPGSVRASNDFGDTSLSINSTGRFFGGAAGNAFLQNASGTIAYLSDIPDLTGYATESWVLGRNYITIADVNSSWDVNTGDLWVGVFSNNLDGRYMLRSNTITSGYGIIASSDFTTAINIEIDTGDLDNRYLRKDIDDSNSTYTLSLGNVDATTATIASTFVLESIPTAAPSSSQYILSLNQTTNEVEKVLFGLDDLGIMVQNYAGDNEFFVPLQTGLRFAAGGDASVSFNAATNTITYLATGGSGSSGILSVFGRTDTNIVAESGDYNTSLVTENPSALYFTEARVRATDLNGLVLNTGSIFSTDNVLQALGKAQGQINARVPTSRTVTINGTAGNISISGTPTQPLSSDVSWTINLANKGTAGTYTKVVTDAQGRVASGGNLTLGDMPSGVLQTLSVSSISDLGGLSISSGNTVYTNSIRTIGTYSDAQSMLDSIGLGAQGIFHYTHTAGATGFPAAVGAGIASWRYSGPTSKSGFLIDATTQDNDNLYYARIAGDGVKRPWQTIASREWVNSVLPTVPTNYITSDTDQSTLSGNKVTSGVWSFSGPDPTSIIVRRTGTSANSSIRIQHDGGSIFVGNPTGNTFGVGLDGNLQANALFTVSSSGIGVNTSTGTMSIGSQSSSYVHYNTDRPAHFFHKEVAVQSQLRSNRGNNDTYADAAGAIAIKGSSNNPYISFHANDGTRYGYVQVLSSGVRLNGNGNGVRLMDLAGTGTQMVTINADGDLARQNIPINGVTSVGTGAHLTGGTITSTGTISLQFDANSYVNDSQGNSRLYFGNTSSSLAFIARASATNQTFEFRNSANSAVWAIGNTGVLTTGSVPWARLTGMPNIVTYSGSPYPQLEVGNAYVRTPNSGLLPPTQGGGTLGTSSWPFNTIYGNTIYEDGTALASKYVGLSGNQTISGTKTFTSELRANILTLGTVANGTTTINMASNNLVRLNSISSNTTYSMSNNSDGRNVQCSVTNSHASNSVTVSVTGAVLLGNNVIGPQKAAVISIVNFGGGQTRYTVVAQT